jgi:hypothetical protein
MNLRGLFPVEIIEEAIDKDGDDDEEEGDNDNDDDSYEAEQKKLENISATDKYLMSLGGSASKVRQKMLDANFLSSL